jgi:hypothetical protein
MRFISVKVDLIDFFGRAASNSTYPSNRRVSIDLGLYWQSSQLMRIAINKTNHKFPIPQQPEKSGYRSRPCSDSANPGWCRGRHRGPWSRQSFGESRWCDLRQVSIGHSISKEQSDHPTALPDAPSGSCRSRIPVYADRRFRFMSISDSDDADH